MAGRAGHAVDFAFLADLPSGIDNSPGLQLWRVKYSSGWKYDNNSTDYAFTPRDTDILVALVDFRADTVTDLKGQSDTVYGIAKGYAGGNLTFTADW